MNVAKFLETFSGFSQTDTTVIQAKLIEASVRMGGPDGKIWGSYATSGQPLTQADFAQGNYAAYLIICDPRGTGMRVDPTKAKESVYYKKWLELMYARTPGITVAGGPRRRFFGPFGGFFP